MQTLEYVALVALWHVGSSLNRDGTHVPGLERWILNPWTTREVRGPRSYLLEVLGFISWRRLGGVVPGLGIKQCGFLSCCSTQCSVVHRLDDLGLVTWYCILPYFISVPYWIVWLG